MTRKISGWRKKIKIEECYEEVIKITTSAIVNMVVDLGGDINGNLYIYNKYLDESYNFLITIYFFRYKKELLFKYELACVLDQRREILKHKLEKLVGINGEKIDYIKIKISKLYSIYTYNIGRSFRINDLGWKAIEKNKFSFKESLHINLFKFFIAYIISILLRDTILEDEPIVGVMFFYVHILGFLTTICYCKF